MIISSGMFACSNNVSENAGCFWNEYLDSLYTNYLCALNSECVDYEGHREDVVYSLSPHLVNCLLDSMIRARIPLHKIGYNILNDIPDSNLKLSQKSIDIIKNESDSCEREIWMLGLSEKNVVNYQFENICKIKKFETRQPTAFELNEYWAFDYENEIFRELNDLAERSLNKAIVKHSYPIGICNGMIEGASVDGFDIKIQSSKSCFVDTIFQPFYYEIIGVDEVYIKVLPLTRMVYDSLHFKFDLPPRTKDNSRVNKICKKKTNHMKVAWVEKGIFFNSTTKKFNKIKKGERVFLEIPCFDDSLALMFNPFHITKTKYPYLLCKMTPAEKNFIGK